MDGDVRYFKLHNTGGFVARIIVHYKEKYKSPAGIISYDAEWKNWESPNYSDICASSERTVDLKNDVNLKSGTLVKLRAYVMAGTDREAGEQYTYDEDSGKTAAYEISGTTLTSKLHKVSYI
ncbi:MAG: hypothetical protein PHV18_06270 [Lachnospiraceae bacterium]|nr:hypothetical protein [Lachnospiraceae bacterium]